MFIEFGYEAMSLRQITARAKVNLAAVNYHFGSKEALMQSVLGRRLDPLNTRRLALLTACEARWPQGMTCDHVLGALFVPALQMARNPDTGGPAFLRLMGRVYSDTSPFVQGYLLGHYAPVFDRFFEAFSRALPSLPRSELGWRLHFALKALAGVLAGDDLNNLLPLFTQGKPMNDASLLARLTALVVATLNAPLPANEENALDQVVELAEAQHPSVVPSSDDTTGGPHGQGNGNSGRVTSNGTPGRSNERAPIQTTTTTATAASPFPGDLFGRTPAPRASADDAVEDAADAADIADNHAGDDHDDAPVTPTARTRALAIRRSNAARAIFPANPMRPWRSPNA
ncbi:TetR/AcrR family transcriptional regulator [uncultured Ralstonia sp.]|uniref:TetR/AcrR family transcriptional regulator n=1 Tax=uncultured Ralstonia sp. TaxID=114715 RepID=UPI0025D8C8EF|nr:TetR/AcrR family transcriptional regulator [uncultured Ralstonia sp.]